MCMFIVVKILQQGRMHNILSLSVGYVQNDILQSLFTMIILHKSRCDAIEHKY